MTNNLLINNYIIYNIKFLCHLFVNNEFRVLSFCHLSLSVCLFLILVDSRFTEQVDSLPDIVDSIPGFVDIFLKVLTLAQAKP